MFKFALSVMAGFALAVVIVVTGTTVAQAERRVITDPYDATNVLHGRRKMNGDMVWTDPFDATYRREVRTYGNPGGIHGPRGIHGDIHNDPHNIHGNR